MDHPLLISWTSIPVLPVSPNSLDYSDVVAHHTVQLVRPLTASTNSRTPVGRRKICPKDDTCTNSLPIASGRLWLVRRPPWLSAPPCWKLSESERQVTSWPGTGGLCSATRDAHRDGLTLTITEAEGEKVAFLQAAETTLPLNWVSWPLFDQQDAVNAELSSTRFSLDSE